MVRQPAPGANHLLHEIFDVRIHGNGGVFARQRQVGAVPFDVANVVEIVVVVAMQPLAAFVVIPDPVLELALEFPHLGVGVIAALAVQGLGVAVANPQLDAFAVQRGVKDVVEVGGVLHPFHQPVLPVFGGGHDLPTFPPVFQFGFPLARGGVVIDGERFRRCPKQIRAELLHVRRGNPTHAQLDANLVMRHVFRLHLHQGIDVGLVFGVHLGGSASRCQLAAHVPREVQVRHLPSAVRVFVCRAMTDQQPPGVLGVGVQQLGNVVDVHATLRPHRDGDGIRRAVRRRFFLEVSRHVAGENVG